MKREVLTLMAILLMISPICAARKKGVMAFSSTSFRFGVFSKRQIRKCVFPFSNMGSSPIVINQVKTTCNCTSVIYTTRPVLPGEKGYVTVMYDGRNYSSGHFRKTVDVISTAENGIVRLFLEGETK